MTILLVLVIILMLAFSALLAATETAITASSPGKMHKLKAEGNKKAAIVINILKVKEKVISTMLIGNSLINTVCTTIAAGLFIDLFNDHHVGTLISSAVMAFTIIVFVEIIPKAIAVVKAEKLALFTAPTIIIFLRILKPVNAVLDATLKVFCYIFRINLKQEISGSEEVRGIIEHHHQEGNVYKSDRDMLGGVLDIRYMTVSEIMVHRSNIMAINSDAPTDEIISFALSSPHTRIPLWKDNKDNIIGVIHVKDLLKNLYETGNDSKSVNLLSLIRDPWFVPDNALVIHQLHAFRERQNHFACVVDEYGDLQGIITLEDILEEIVGQINDEHDRFNEAIIKKSDSEFVINGLTTIRDLNRELNWTLPDHDANTIAGLIIHEIQRIPDQGESIEMFNLKFTIIRKTANRVESIKATILQTQDVLSD